MSTHPIQQEIEERLASAHPGVEVLLAEVVGGDTLRLFIDHPDGVTLAIVTCPKAVVATAVAVVPGGAIATVGKLV